MGNLEAEAVVRKPGMREVLNPRITLLLAVALLSSAAMYMVMPFMALYFHEALHFSVAAAGTLVGLPFLASMVFGVMAGLLNDRLGVVRSFVVAGTVYAFAIGGIGLVHSATVIVVLLIVSGIVMPITSSGLQTLVNQAATSDYRGAAQNYLYWASNTGILVGLLVSAEVLSGGHSPVTFLVLAVIRLAVAGVVLVAFHRSARPEKDSIPSPPRAKKPGVIASLKAAGTDQALLFAALTMMLLIFMEGQLSSTVPLDLVSSFKNGSQLLGPLVAIDSVVVVLCQPLALKFIPARRPLLWFGLGAVATGGGLALGGLVNTVPAWIVGMVLYSLGEVLWASKLNDLLGQLPPEGSESLYFAAVITGQYFALFLGTTVGSTLLHVPNVLFSGMILLGILATLAYRVSARALRLRTVREQTAKEQVVQAPIPGTETPAPESRTASGSVLSQGLTAFYAPHEGAVGSDFGIPMPRERMVLLADLEERDWERFLAFAEERSYSEGDTLVEYGADDRALYLVSEGALEVLVPGPEGRERRLTIIEQGSVFGEQSFIDEQPRSASIRALTSGTLRRLDWAGFRTLATEDPVLAERVMADLARILSERLRKTTEYVNLLAGA